MSYAELGDFLSLIIFLLATLLMPFFYGMIGRSLLSLGRRVFCVIFKQMETPESHRITFDRDVLCSFQWLLGLLSHLVFSMFFTVIGLPLPYACVLSFFLLIVPSLDVLKALVCSGVSRSNYMNWMKIDFSFIVFMSIVLFLGISLFDADIGIRTLWINNYGDIPFHLGMISNMTFSERSLFEYHMYPGEKLSYPFLINYWTALFWSFHPTWKTLSFLFTVQWVFIWGVLFFLLRKSVYGILPWVLLFAGGTIPVFLAQIGFDIPSLQEDLSHRYINSGYPVSVLMGSVWVTQRTSLMGLLVAGASLLLFFEILKKNQVESNQDDFSAYGTYYFFLSLVLACGLLCHFHIAAVAIAYIASVLLLSVLNGIRNRSYRKKIASLLVFSLFLLIFSSPVFILYHGKSGMMQFVSGWMTDSGVPASLEWLYEYAPFFKTSPALVPVPFWILNLGIWLCIVPLVFRSAGFLLSIPVLVLFIGLNVVQLSVWPWDSLKGFIGILLIILCLQRQYGVSSAFLLICFIISLIPGLYETLFIFSKGTYHQIYSQEDLERINAIRKNTEASSVIAAKPDHLSPITMAGRRLYVGYDGWLFSHSINYTQRMNSNGDLEQLLSQGRYTSVEGEKSLIPDYIYRPHDDQAFWVKKPEELVATGLLMETEVAGLYRVLR